MVNYFWPLKVKFWKFIPLSLLSPISTYNTSELNDSLFTRKTSWWYKIQYTCIFISKHRLIFTSFYVRCRTFSRHRISDFSSLLHLYCYFSPSNNCHVNIFHIFCYFFLSFLHLGQFGKKSLLKATIMNDRRSWYHKIVNYNKSTYIIFCILF